MNKYTQIMSLLDQIIEKNLYYDNYIENNDQKNFFNKMFAGGDSWDLHHLKVLRSLIEEYEKENNAKS